MKSLAIAFSLILTNAAFAQSPFDQFAGSYKPREVVHIESKNAKDCVRFSLANLKTVEVVKSSEGYRETNKVNFYSLLNNSETISYHPIMEYKDSNAHGFVSYAVTDGDESFAENEWGNLSALENKKNEGLLVRLTRNTDNTVQLFVEEFRKEFDEYVAYCRYSVSLTKQL